MVGQATDRDRGGALGKNAPCHPAVRVPGVRDFWILIAAECSLFSFFFITYMIGRGGDVDLYRTSQQALSRDLGVFNTCVLIIGSWSVMQALGSLRREHARQASHYLAGVIGCGVIFAGVKVFEYADKISHGLFPTTNDFFTFYFVLTMVHMVHLVIATVVLAVMRRGVMAGHYHSGQMDVLESGAIYWHLVDLLWMFLFALLYLLQ
ncbi:cytochrome c oxidase subunit 3 [Novosphingobium sediminicola]|uniref:Nitric oxide reductase NorE protein n=1 Tax=Novosphingobium sediminicola TaxID=563162 RepID=A0A7W6CNB1_9SPHN|nr:cytochrome c oxidase subunit 3 [Novosphingobium sediminicola]MBB3957533.1 nitric oxide reductase NorE protein [Novosphingobium sediminicola]